MNYLPGQLVRVAYNVGDLGHGWCAARTLGVITSTDERNIYVKLPDQENPKKYVWYSCPWHEAKECLLSPYEPKYPKIYATYQGKDDYGWERFVTEEGQEIVQKHFSRSGSTPTKLRAAWYQFIQEVGYRKALVEFGLMPIGTKVKLYQRNDGWYYRHLGE